MGRHNNSYYWQPHGVDVVAKKDWLMPTKRLPLFPTEAMEAHTLVAYLRVKGLKFHHSPNETGSSPEARRRAIRVKREGTSKGFPDYVILVGGSMLFIELKRVKGSVTSPEQKEWIEAINAIPNCQAVICKGAQAAIDIIEQLVPASTDTSF